MVEIDIYVDRAEPVVCMIIPQDFFRSKNLMSFFSSLMRLSASSEEYSY